jgi:hypothetical protein
MRLFTSEGWTMKNILMGFACVSNNRAENLKSFAFCWANIRVFTLDACFMNHEKLYPLLNGFKHQPRFCSIDSNTNLVYLAHCLFQLSLLFLSVDIFFGTFGFCDVTSIKMKWCRQNTFIYFTSTKNRTTVQKTIHSTHYDRIYKKKSCQIFWGATMTTKYTSEI